MSDSRQPIFRMQQRVSCSIDLFNDGSHPEAAEDQLLVVAGGPGEIVQIGHHGEANVPVYMVDFGVAVIGCLEEELAPEGAAVGALPGPADEVAQ